MMPQLMKKANATDVRMAKVNFMGANIINSPRHVSPGRGTAKADAAHLGLRDGIPVGFSNSFLLFL
jgi:hypothetical protein